MPRENCPVHDVTCWQCGWKVYRCSRCRGCYQCEHEALYENGVWVWLCRDNRKRPAICEDCGCGMKKQAQPILTGWRFPTPIMQDWPVKF